MTTRFATIYDELVTLIEGLTFDDGKQYTVNNYHYNLTQESRAAKDRTFSIGVEEVQRLPDYGYQNVTDNIWQIAITLCRRRLRDLRLQEKLLSNDIEKMIVTLENASNSGSAAFIEFVNLDIRREGDFDFIEFHFIVRASLSYTI